MNAIVTELRDPRWIPGAEGFAEDLRKRCAAYEHAAPDGPPTRWTPEYAGQRFCAAVKSGGRWHGPKAFGNNWPSVLVEFSDLVDIQARGEASRAKEIEYDHLVDLDEPEPEARLMTPTLAEEAMRWPMLYLRDDTRAATCLMVWAMAQARFIRIEPFLRRMRLAEKRLRVISGLQARAMAGQLTGSERALWAAWREKLAALRPEAKAQVRLDLTRLAAGEAYVSSKTTLHRWRRRALDALSDALERDRVSVR